MNRKRLITSGFGLMMLCALLFSSVGAAAGGVGAPAAPSASAFYTIAIDSPTNNSFTNVDAMTVTWTVSDLGADPYWNESRIFTDGTWSAWYNETDNSSTTYDPLLDGTYFVNIRTMIDDGEQNLANVTFTIDTVDPTVAVDFPTDGLETNDTNITLSWTADGTGSPLDEFDVTVTDGVTEWVLTVEGDVFEIPVGNVTGFNLPDGDYTVNVTAYDEAGNEATSADVDFTVTPIVEITFPLEDSFTNLVNFTATWEVSLTDSPLDHFSVNLTNDDTGYYSGWINVGTDLSAWITNFTDDNEDLTDGNWTLYVNVTDDAATDYIDDAPFTVDTVPPEIDFIVPTEDEPYFTNNNSFDAVWEYAVDPLDTPIVDQLVTLSNGTFNVTVDVDPADLGVNVADVWGDALPDGLYTLSVNATDAADNWYNESVDFTVDTAAPEVDFIVPPEYTNDNNFTAAWEYEVDPLGTPIANQTLWIENETGFVMGIAYPDVDVFEFPIWTLLNNHTLADGNYTMYLNATDAAGNWYVEEMEFTVDTVPPEFDFVVPPEDPWITNDNNFTASWEYEPDLLETPIVSQLVTITDGVTNMTLSVDVADQSVSVYDVWGDVLPDGVYVIYMNATDAAGNWYNESVVFMVDTIEPDVDIISPANPPTPFGTNLEDITFLLDIDEEGGGIDYINVSIEDNAGSIVWLEDVDFTNIGGDNYTVLVTDLPEQNVNATFYVFDLAGNVGNDTVWLFVDHEAPFLTILYPVDGSYFNATHTMITALWETGDPDGMMANTEVWLNGAIIANQSWELMYVNITDAMWTNNSWNNLTIKSFDIAYNVNVKSVEFYIDIVNPSIVIATPLEGEYIASSTVDVTWGAEDLQSGINYTQIRLVGVTDWIGVGTDEAYEFTDLLDGAYTVEVRTFDMAMNMDTDSRSFTVDTSIPVVTISDPSEGARFAVDVVTVYWNVTEATTSIDLMQYMIDGGAWTDVATNSNEFDALADGLHNVVIRAFDLAMNAGYGYVNFTTDITDPIVTISFPAANAILNYNTTTVWWNATDATTGIDHCTYSLDGGAAVTVSGAGPQFSHQFINLTDGTHTVLIIAYDGVGNHKSASVTFKVDTHAPTIQILFPSAGAYYHTATINGTWNITDSVSGVKQIMVKLDNGSWVNIAYNQTHQFVGLTTGNHTIYLQAEDNATNVAEANVTFHIDLVAPSITSTSPSGVAVPLRTSIVIVFSKTMLKSSVGIAITPAPTARGDPVWSNGNKTVTYYVEFADSKTYTVAVHGTDLAGNAIAGSTSYSFSSLTWVHGTVVDVNGNILPKANVTLTSTLAGGSVYYTTSSDMGAIGVLVPAGEYAIKTTLSGYDTNSKTVTVGPGLSANDLGNVQLTKTMDWTLPIVIIVVGLIAVLAILFLARRK